MNKTLKKQVRIGFICEGDPRDRRTWSGTPYGVFSSLEKLGCSVEWIRPQGCFLSIFLFFVKYINGVLLKFFRLNCALLRLPAVVKIRSRRFCVNDEDFDFIVSIGLTACAYYRTKLPIVAVIDATFDSFNGYYGPRTLPFFFKYADKTEQLSANCAWTIIAASHWTKESLLSHYSIPEERIRVWQLGANISNVVDREIKFPHANEELRLLFVGFDTQRKGLDIAISTTQILKESFGRKVRLDVVGTDGVGYPNLPSLVNFHGKLNKNKKEEMALFERIVSDAHVFILPTKAECAGMVFSEAAANGLPVFSYDTGGVGSYVETGKNGCLLPLGASANAFAEKIVECWDGNRFPSFSKQGRRIFNANLNWALWPERFRGLIRDFDERTT